MSERASTSNGEFCLLTDGRWTEGGRKGRHEEKGSAASLRHGRVGEGEGEGGRKGGVINQIVTGPNHAALPCLPPCLLGRCQRGI